MSCQHEEEAIGAARALAIAQTEYANEFLMSKGLGNPPKTDGHAHQAAIAATRGALIVKETELTIAMKRLEKHTC